MTSSASLELPAARHLNGSCFGSDRTSATAEPETAAGGTDVVDAASTRRRPRRPKYGRLKRIAVVERSSTDEPETARLSDRKCSIVVVEERYDRALDRVDSIALRLDPAVVDASTPSAAAARRSVSASSALTSSGSFRFGSTSYGTVVANTTTPGCFVKLPPDGDDASDAMSFRSSTIPAVAADASKSGTTMTGENDGRKTWTIKQYVKRVVAMVFSTVGVLSLMVGYTVLGGYVFMRLEAPNEVAVKADVRRAMLSHVESLWALTAQLNVLHRRDWSAMAQQVLDNFTREVYVATKHLGYEYEQPDKKSGSGNDDDGGGLDDDGKELSNLQWNFAGSLLYSITVITTIGAYFNLSCVLYNTLRNCCFGARNNGRMDTLNFEQGKLRKICLDLTLKIERE